VIPRWASPWTPSRAGPDRDDGARAVPGARPGSGNGGSPPPRGERLLPGIDVLLTVHMDGREGCQRPRCWSGWDGSHASHSRHEGDEWTLGTPRQTQWSRTTACAARLLLPKRISSGAPRHLGIRGAGDHARTAPDWTDERIRWCWRMSSPNKARRLAHQMGAESRAGG